MDLEVLKSGKIGYFEGFDKLNLGSMSEIFIKSIIEYVLTDNIIFFYV